VEVRGLKAWIFIRPVAGEEAVENLLWMVE
jgi:hypothetical protein